MNIIDIKAALEKDKISKGAVYINAMPQVRSGKKNDFMVGFFFYHTEMIEFKIWEESIFSIIQIHGPGLYYADVIGSEFNGMIYLTVRHIEVLNDETINKRDFLKQVPRDFLDEEWRKMIIATSKNGVSQMCWELIQKMLSDPELENRFHTEAAAIRHHDNQIGGLSYHTVKMLRILVALFRNNPTLKNHGDLLTMGIALHDIGKVFEYNDMEMGQYWYSNHRVRGIEFLTKFKEEIIAHYDETFYRQLQAIISGHHGDYGDRPSTIATAIIHYVDTIESQVTGLLQEEAKSSDHRIFIKDWGFLMGLDG